MISLREQIEGLIGERQYQLVANLKKQFMGTYETFDILGDIIFLTFESSLSHEGHSPMTELLTIEDCLNKKYVYPIQKSWEIRNTTGRFRNLRYSPLTLFEIHSDRIEELPYMTNLDNIKWKITGFSMTALYQWLIPNIELCFANGDQFQLPPAGNSHSPLLSFEFSQLQVINKYCSNRSDAEFVLKNLYVPMIPNTFDNGHAVKDAVIDLKNRVIDIEARLRRFEQIGKGEVT